MENSILSIFTDGAARSNPGPAAATFIIVQDDQPIHQESVYLGTQTNNQAEYQAIIKALTKANQYSKGKITIFSDSELVVKQLIGEYRIKQPHLRTLRDKIFELRKDFSQIDFKHVKRENKWIKLADKLCNQTLNLQTEK